jgi:hypothetical protein
MRHVLISILWLVAALNILVEQELFTLPEHPSPFAIYCGVCFVRSLTFCVVFCRSLFVLSSFFHLFIVLSMLLWFEVSDYAFANVSNEELINWDKWHMLRNMSVLISEYCGVPEEDSNPFFVVCTKYYYYIGYLPKYTRALVNLLRYILSFIIARDKRRLKGNAKR